MRPPEFRGHIINGHPNWHDCLKELFEAREEAGVPKNPSPDADALRTIVEAREDGRRLVVTRPEKARRFRRSCGLFGGQFLRVVRAVGSTVL
jgi:hypothetical protein